MWRAYTGQFVDIGGIDLTPLESKEEAPDGAGAKS